MDAESYWAGYLAARFERFSTEKKQLIGSEYNSNPTYWNEIIEQEWAIMKSRLETGFDISLFRDSRFVEPNIIEKPGFSLNLDSSEHVHIGAWVNLSGSLK